ncbi:unnamed protein product [Absidia cylindrospora]
MNPSEGGMERAALATVFGVREYTEPKVFWERQILANNTTTTTPSNNDEEQQPHPTSTFGISQGYVSITSKLYSVIPWPATSPLTDVNNCHPHRHKILNSNSNNNISTLLILNKALHPM